MKIPHPAELHPRIVELENKRNSLHTEKTTKVAEAAIIRARIQESPNNGNAAQNRVREILGEVPLPETAPDMARLEQLLRELTDINSALGILDCAIQKEKTIASRLVCEAVKPEATRLGKKFAKAFLDLHVSHSEYNQFLDSVEDTGASAASLGRVWPSSLGHPREISGGYYWGFKEFLEAGLIEHMPSTAR